MATAALCFGLLLSAGAGSAQKKGKDNQSGYDRSAKATMIHPAIVYVAADDSSSHVTEVTIGHEVVVSQRNGSWARVFANTDADDEKYQGDDAPEFGDDATPPMSGWIKDKGIVSPVTPNGDAILFGTAANLEEQASAPHAPKNAAQAAHLLYKRVAAYFPDSPLAAEAAWRAADIRWQIDKADIRTLPSAKEQESYLRPQIYDGDLNKVMKTYPGAKQAALAAYDLLDNKLCGDWQGLPKCPEMEAGLYEKYAERYPDSPKAAEALYEATYREGVLVEMYLVQEDKGRSQHAADAAQGLAAQMKQRYAQSDFTARAASIAYRVQQQIPVYGSDRD
ncbi:MAG TPA: hypothetical protein VII58_04650 [Acidobacteriaceae bacterium]